MVNRSISTGLSGLEDDAHLAWFRERAHRHDEGWQAWRERLPEDPRLIRLPELPVEPATLPDLHAMVRQILRADLGEPLPRFESLI